MQDQLQEEEALREVRRLRTKVRRDSRGWLALGLLMAGWSVIGFIAEALPGPIQLLLLAALLALTAGTVIYLERTSKRFGGARRPQIVARYMVLQLGLLAVGMSVWLVAGHLPISPYLWAAAAAFLPLGAGLLIWRLWYGTVVPWLAAFVAQVFLHGTLQRVIGREGPWMGMGLVIDWLVAGYVCMFLTVRHLPEEEEAVTQ